MGGFPQEDMGLVWEHFVLNEMMAQLQSREIRYWRDKRGHEVDFVLARRKEAPLAIECKWSAETFAPQPLLAFRRQHPQGKNLVVAYDADRAFTHTYNGVEVRFVSLGELIAEIVGKAV